MGAILLIGEKLNSTRASVKKIFEDRDEPSLVDLAREQIDGGASCIDLNASMLMEGEEAALRWGTRAVREKLHVSVVLDSPNAKVLTYLAGEFGSGVILNSLTCDEEILGEAIPAVARSGAGAVVMLKDRRGIPATVAGKLDLAERAVAAASKHGMPHERLYLDPVFAPLATSPGGLLGTLDAIRALKERYPDCARIGGLSNVSFGMPERKLLNRVFAGMAAGAGITALICDTTDIELIKTLKAAEALTGLDPKSRGFLEFYRRFRKSD